MRCPQPIVQRRSLKQKMFSIAWLIVSIMTVATTGAFAAAPKKDPTMTTLTAGRCCAVIELRQYTLKSGQRDVLIDLFEREFVETQEAVGVHLVGQFRDLDRPDRFVWIRGFSDMASRAQSLQAFYGGPVWQAHREAANATMIDSDNVLLLRPVTEDSAFSPSAGTRAPVGTTTHSSARIVATTYYFAAPVGEAFGKFFDAEMAPELAASGGAPIASFETESAENTFPRLPVRTGEHVFVWFARFASDTALREHDARMAASSKWMTQVLPKLRDQLKSPPERLLLEPTARSLLR